MEIMSLASPVTLKERRYLFARCVVVKIVPSSHCPEKDHRVHLKGRMTRVLAGKIKPGIESHCEQLLHVGSTGPICVVYMCLIKKWCIRELIA